jgi:uncharacterized membrane protein YfcA
VILSLPPATLAVVAAALLLSGFVVGLNGFGFSVVGTSTLATVLGAESAVVVMLLPILAANASLVGELDRSSLRSCVARFWPYVAAALAGTLAGMALLARLPARPLLVGLGLFTVAYVALSQETVEIPGVAWVAGRCFGESMPAKVALGFVSGAVFGATNVGVQVVAYLQSRGLDHGVFVGVMAMVFLGISLTRVGAAAALGLYGGSALLAVSAAGVLPGLAGVAAGKRLRSTVPARYRRAGVFALLTVIGVRLIAG